MIRYQLRIHNRAGVRKAIVVDFLQLAYVREVNAPGMAEFVLRADHAAIPYMELDGIVEIWRSDLEQGVAWYLDFTGLFRYEERRANSDGRSTYTARCPGIMHLLSRPVVAYKSGAANRSTFTSAKAETIAKTLVTYNATTSGTTGDGRVRNAENLGVTLEADAARGNSMDFACAWQNLLSSLQKVASIGGGDFDLEVSAPGQYEFTWYAGQLGTDRSASVVFSLSYGNMANPRLVRNWLGERTVAIVGGQGQDSTRTLVTRTGATYAAGYRASEVFVSAVQYTTTAGLNGVGDAKLYETETRDELTFDVLQVPQTLYGEHYFLGDLVTGVYEGVTATKKIRKVSIGVAGTGEETIQVELSNE